GWLKNVSAHLSVNVLTILLIAALVFSYRLLDNWLNYLSSETGVSSSEIVAQPALAAWAGDPVVAPSADARRPATRARLACERA
ncbi:hypothetical protein LXA47_29975, partial [Massilia sp. P8910]|uniref:hypothetical protein n=1 Tax=Massilia antarctica TaxID=2765360 RepID=UPI001E28AFA2